MRHDPALRFAIHPAFAGRLRALGLASPGAILDLPGEVVCGHPDRHVLRVELPGFSRALYLKRQHLVTRRERYRNWRAGFGWVSRSLRERSLLDELATLGLPCPRWIAAGEERGGRAFLLVEEVEGAVDLHQYLQSPSKLPGNRAALARRIGGLIAALHGAGFTTPDLTAKHLLVSPQGIIPIDWQSAERCSRVSMSHRIRALAVLHASLPGRLASPRDRLRVLWSALRSLRVEDRNSFATLAHRIDAEAQRLGGRMSIRDQRSANGVSQRLVWVAGEAVCAIPSIALTWPSPAIAPPFYGAPPGRYSIRLEDGRPAHLIRGRSFDPLGRFVAQLRGKPWRSPGARLGRMLFHLERHGIPAPQLLAFGQRVTSRVSAEWFALHTPLPLLITEPTSGVTLQLGCRLRQLHEAGCRPTGDPRTTFGMEGTVLVRDVASLRLVKRLTRRDRHDDLRRMASRLPSELRTPLFAGYEQVDRRDTPVSLGRVLVGLGR